MVIHIEKLYNITKKPLRPIVMLQIVQNQII